MITYPPNYLQMYFSWIFLLILIGRCSGNSRDLHLKKIKEIYPKLGNALVYYDVNGDGILDSDEIDLSFDDIQAVFNKYKDTEAENQKVEDDVLKGDGNKKELKGRAESAQSKDKENIKPSWLSAPVIVALFLGGVTCTICYFIFNKKNLSSENKQVDVVNREVWLNRISHAKTDKDHTKTKVSLTEQSDQTEENLHRSTERLTETFQSEETSEKLNLSIKSERRKKSELSESSNQDMVKEVKADTKNIETPESTDIKILDSSNSDVKKENKLLTDGIVQSASPGIENVSSKENLEHKSETTNVKKPESTRNLSSDITRDLAENEFLEKNGVAIAPDAAPKDNLATELTVNKITPETVNFVEPDSKNTKIFVSPITDTTQTSEEGASFNDNVEKKKHTNISKETYNKITLKEFLEDILNCKIEIKKDKTQYFSGSLAVKEEEFPQNAEEIPEKLSAILRLIISRQINRIHYILSCFDKYEAHDIEHNEMIMAASNWFQLKTVDVIYDSIQQVVGASADEDLWSDCETGDVVNDAVDFLWRIAGWSKDGITVSPRLLTLLLDYDRQGNKAVSLLTSLVQAAGKRVQSVKRVDEIVLEEYNTLSGLEILLSNVNISSVLEVILQEEVRVAEENLGIYFERNSIFGPLMSVSSVPNAKKMGGVMSLTGNSVVPFVELQRKSPQLLDSDIKILEKSIQDGFHQCQNSIHNALKKAVSNKMTREAGLSWLSAVVRLNDIRTTSLQVTDAQTQTCCSDGFMLNFCAIMLKFFVPIYGNIEKVNKIDLMYATSAACRLNYHFETCLASGQIVSENEIQKNVGALSTELQNPHSFITECFHITQRSLSVGLIPALIHYNRMHSDFSNKQHVVAGTSKEKEIKDTHLLVTLMWDTSLADTELIKNITMFYLTQSQLLLNIISSSQNENKTVQLKDERLMFQQIPEFCVKDMAIWFQFVASHAVHVHKGILWGLSLSPFVDCCVMLLERPDLMPGPIAASKLVSSLLHFVQTSTNKRSLGWSNSDMSDLAFMVHTSPTVQNKLGPALLHTYTSVDVVEGLDVDKDEFDKYTARAHITQLIKHLWNRPDFKENILQQHQTEQFQNFLGAILDTLLYMLHDALSRMANVKRLELLKDNDTEWNSLSSKEQSDRTSFLMNEEHVGRGFMALANQTLAFILLLTEEEVVSSCFNQKPLSHRSAAAICGFLLSLCGTKAKDYKVKNMSKYNFDPKTLLTNIVKLIQNIYKSDTTENGGFIKALTDDSDFEVETLQKAHDVIYSKGLAHEDFVTQFADLIKQLRDQQQSTELDIKSKENKFDWLKEAEMTEINVEEILDSYTKIMAPLRFDASDLAESHSYQSNTQTLDPRSPKVKALMKEMKQLQQSLPIHPNAAIYVRQDEDRMDLIRAMITGPVDTPYSLGCFLFDIYFPSSYPYNPPLVKLITTGNGTVRFNPNLYSDGKVCLSLLGTWHAGDASEKWNAGKSTLYQVLVSIQSIILTSDPMFNEPGYDGMRETNDGKQQSGQYNWKIQLQTLRHAILGNIKNPPPGFKDLILRHFYIQKDYVLKQCVEWIRGCEDEDLTKRLQVVCDDIYEQLDKMEMPDTHEEEEEGISD